MIEGKDQINKQKKGKTKIFPWVMLLLLILFIFSTLLNTISSSPDDKKTENKNGKVIVGQEKKTEDATETSNGKEKVIGKIEVLISELNFRKSPEISESNIIGNFKKGEKVNVIGKEEGWYKLKTKDNKIGYVNADNRYVKYSGE